MIPNPGQKTNKMTTEQTEIDYCYEKFIGNHVQAIEPKQKSFETAQGKQTYNEIPIQYNYGSDENPIIDSCFFEFPIVSTNGGIVCKKEEKKSRNPGDPPYMKESYSMMFVFDLQDNDCVKCLSKLDELHRGVARAIFPYKTKIGLPYFDPNNPQATGLKNPVYYKMDELTNEPVKGRNPSIWVKMNHWKNNKTLFTDLNGNPIDWSLLYDVEAKMIPLIHVEKVYSGATTSIQMKMVSAVITDIAPLNTRSRQVNTLERLKQKYSGLADTVASQLAQLRMEKQDVLDDGNFQAQNAQLPGNAGQMHQIPTGGSPGGMHGNQQQLNEFLGGAPVQQSPPLQQVQQVTLPTAPPVQPQQPQTQPQQPPPQLQQTLHMPQGAQPVQFNPVSQAVGGQAMLQIQ